MTKTVRVLAAMGVALLALLTFAGTASAQTAGSYSGAVITTPPTGEVLGETTARCVGFPPDTQVTFSLDGKVLGTAVTDANGDCTFPYQLPNACGTYTLTATGGAVVRTTTVTVTGCPAAPVAASGALPYTGSSTTVPFAQIGAALVVFGALVTLLVRKRQHA